VRYRCDPERRKRYKTVELIVAEPDWAPPPGPDDLVQVRVAFGEEALRQRVKQAGVTGPIALYPKDNEKRV
jgi:hypothetical protein